LVNTPPRLLEHGVCGIDSYDLAFRRDLLLQEREVQPRSASELQYGIAGMKVQGVHRLFPLTPLSETDKIV